MLQDSFLQHTLPILGLPHSFTRLQQTLHICVQAEKLEEMLKKKDVKIDKVLNFQVTSTI